MTLSPQGLWAARTNKWIEQSIAYNITKRERISKPQSQHYKVMSLTVCDEYFAVTFQFQSEHRKNMNSEANDNMVD